MKNQLFVLIESFIQTDAGFKAPIKESFIITKIHNKKNRHHGGFDDIA